MRTHSRALRHSFLSYVDVVVPESVVVMCLCASRRVCGVASVSIVYLEARALSAVNVYVYSPPCFRIPRNLLAPALFPRRN